LDRKGIGRAITALAQLKSFNHFGKYGSGYNLAAIQRSNAV
jgi:hypothetical protein